MTHFIFFTLFLTDSLEKCQTKSFKNEYSTFCNFQILYHKSTVKKMNDHYSAGLLWRDDLKMSSNDQALAKRRLKVLKRRFDKDPDQFQRYS